MKITLVKGWYTFKKWWSMKINFLGMLLSAIGLIYENILFNWGVLPNEFKESIPTSWIFTATIFFFIATSFAAVIRQPKVHEQVERDSCEGCMGSEGKPNIP